MVYSVAQRKQKSLETKIRRAKIQAKAQHPDFKNDHPSEAREAGKTTPDFTELVKRVQTEHQKFLDRAQQRREKLGERI